MTEPLINILIRTSGRPNLFARCMASVDRQTYRNVRVLVGYDQPTTYLSRNVERYAMVKPNDEPYFYNDYCNQLKAHVTEGWMFFLDDDDFLIHDRALEYLAPHLTDPDRAVIVQFERSGKPKPNGYLMASKRIVSGHVGLPSLVLHAQHKNAAQVKTHADNTDYLYIKAVTDLIGAKFVPQVLVGTDRRSWGERGEYYKPKVTSYQ